MRRRHAWWLQWLLLITVVRAKVYDRCELAMELHDRFKFAKRDLDKWLCLAYWESRFDTRAYHKGKYDGSGDHGIFQINDKHWCQPHEGYSENVCRMPCYLLRDDNLYDDVECVNKIFRRHGFHAWMMFSHKCSGNTLEFFNGCDFRMRRGDVGPSPSGLQITIEPPPILDKLSQLAKGIYDVGDQAQTSPARRSPSTGLAVYHGPQAPQGNHMPDRWTPPNVELERLNAHRQSTIRRPPPHVQSLAQPHRIPPPRGRPPPRRLHPGSLPQESIPTLVMVPPVQQLPAPRRRQRRPLPPQKQQLMFLQPQSGVALQDNSDLFGLEQALGPLAGPLMGPIGRRGTADPQLPLPVHVPPPPQMVVFKKTKPRRLLGGLRLRPFLGYARSGRASPKIGDEDEGEDAKDEEKPD